MTTRTRRGAGRRRWLVYAVLIVGAIATVTPFAWLVRSSLMSDTQMFLFPPKWIPDPVLVENYFGALTAQPFLRYFLNTMLIEAVVVPGIMITCSMAAFAFSRLRWRGRNLIFGILLSSLLLPYAATLIPTFIMWQYLGAVGTYLPLTVPAWLGGGAWGMFSVFLLRQFFMTIPRELDEAAYIDGANPLRVYWQVILPNSKPALAVVAVFVFIAVWNDFLNPLIYLTDEDTFTLSVGVSAFKSLYASQWGYLMAAATAVTVPVIVVFFIGQRRLVEGISMTGIKG
jgi:multiple sugar transport system permease protein